MRPEIWDHSQVGFQGSNASGGRIALLPGACWAHGASKMATLGASLLPCIYSVSELRRACFRQARVAQTVASARRIVSCSCLCASSLCPQFPHVPAPTFGVFQIEGEAGSFLSHFTGVHLFFRRFR